MDLSSKNFLSFVLYPLHLTLLVTDSSVVKYEIFFVLEFCALTI